MADLSKLSIDRIVSICSVIIALAGAGYSMMHNQNSLEYLTKSDFNTFQIENVKKMTSLEGTVQNGFIGVTQQLASLNFVGTKDFQDFKDKTIASQFELQKSIDFLKKDLESLERNTGDNTAKIIAIEQRIAVLEALKNRSS